MLIYPVADQPGKRVYFAFCALPEPLQIREIPVEIDMKATTPHEVLK